jgi:hypothetical protein
MLEVLLKAGADINSVAPTMRTPLVLAFEYGKLPMAKLLLGEASCGMGRVAVLIRTQSASGHQQKSETLVSFTYYVHGCTLECPEHRRCSALPHCALLTTPAANAEMQQPCHAAQWGQKACVQARVHKLLQPLPQYLLVLQVSCCLLCAMADAQTMLLCC